MATYDTGMSRSGPGIMLQHLLRGDDDQIEDGIQVLARLNADIVLLTDFDYDLDGAAVSALKDRLGRLGVIYADALALRPNTGIKTWLDMNHDGQFSGPRDAQAYGRFAGQAGMAILSRFPIDRSHILDMTAVLWKDLPGADLPPDMTEQEKLLQRLSNAGHYVVPIAYSPGMTLNLMAYSATSPLFDGPEDRNGRRNADETNLWLHFLKGDLPQSPLSKAPFRKPMGPFVLLGQPNLDPWHGEGRPEALRALLASPYVRDTKPRNAGARDDPGRAGDASFHTALVGKSGKGMRLDVVLPARGIRVLSSGVYWPADSDPFASRIAAASRHRPVWVAIRLEDGAKGGGERVVRGGLGSGSPGGGTPNPSEGPIGSTAQSSPTPVSSNDTPVSLDDDSAAATSSAAADSTSGADSTAGTSSDSAATGESATSSGAESADSAGSAGSDGEGGEADSAGSAGG